MRKMLQTLILVFIASAVSCSSDDNEGDNDNNSSIIALFLPEMCAWNTGRYGFVDSYYKRRGDSIVIKTVKTAKTTPITNYPYYTFEPLETPETIFYHIDLSNSQIIKNPEGVGSIIIHKGMEYKYRKYSTLHNDEHWGFHITVPDNSIGTFIAVTQ